MNIKYYFYTVSYQASPTQSTITNGVLVTHKDYFSLGFLLNVAFKEHQNTVVRWWSELSRDAIIDYLGMQKVLAMENALLQEKAKNNDGGCTHLRLVTEDE